MLTYEYALLVPADKLLAFVVEVAKKPSRLAGTSREKDAVVICDLKSGQTARFVVAGDMLRVLLPSTMVTIVNSVCSRLTCVKAIGPKAVQGKNVVKPTKECEPAKDVLARHMETEGFKKYILVLPEALDGASRSVFRRDGALDRYLTNLPKFAQAAFDPAKSKAGLAKLASDNALTHFSESISLTAQRDYPEDYTAMYNGQPTLFPMHVTIGTGHSPIDCMSIHFALDRSIQKLVIARFDRHGRGAK